MEALTEAYIDFKMPSSGYQSKGGNQMTQVQSLEVFIYRFNHEIHLPVPNNIMSLSESATPRLLSRTEAWALRGGGGPSPLYHTDIKLHCSMMSLLWVVVVLSLGDDSVTVWDAE